jgi:YHS domain-containing protein
MKKLITVGLGLILALSVAGVGLAAPVQAQTVCPVLGGHINKEIYADSQAKRVYFCCPGCIGVFKNNPEKYLNKLEEQGITPEKSPGAK